MTTKTPTPAATHQSWPLVKEADVLAAQPQIEFMLAPGRPPLTMEPKHKDDAAIDLPCWEPEINEWTIWPNSVCELPTGIRICLPRELGARVVPRSSTFVKLGLNVYEGLIDPGYTGELRIWAFNTRPHPVTVRTGQRIAQLVPFWIPRPRWVRVSAFRVTERGDNGFGSTGR